MNSSYPSTINVKRKRVRKIGIKVGVKPLDAKGETGIHLVAYR